MAVPRLVVLHQLPGKDEAVLDLAQKSFVIGRKADCHIRIQLRHVSRYNTLLEVDEDGKVVHSLLSFFAGMPLSFISFLSLLPSSVSPLPPLFPALPVARAGLGFGHQGQTPHQGE